MAYLVLIDFADEEQALQFAEAHLDGELQTYDDHEPIKLHGKVVAIYKRPTKYHFPHTTEAGDSKKTGTSWTKGQKWGWWVCAGCGYPSGLYWQNVIEKESSFGKNILTKLFDMEEQP